MQCELVKYNIKSGIRGFIPDAAFQMCAGEEAPARRNYLN